MAFCLSNGDEKDFSFMFRGSSSQGDFFRGAEELHNLNHNFSVSNVVLKYFDRMKGAVTVSVYSEACTKAYI